MWGTQDLWLGQTYLKSVSRAERYVEASHLDGCAGGSEDLSIGLDGNRGFVSQVGGRFADYSDHIAVNGRCANRGLAVAGSGGTKEGFKGGQR